MTLSLAFERDPLFGDLSNPLLKIRTKIKIGSGCFWIWKARDFFWFWIEDSPDFFGLFCNHVDYSTFPPGDRFFEIVPYLKSERQLHNLLKNQIHHGRWTRAISVSDPRKEKSGVWRIVWRRRDFLLQNAATGRAVTFQPETNWPKDSPYWRDMNRLNESTQWFAERFEPLLLERRGRLASAFEFLELPLEEQEQPVRFGRATVEEFGNVLRAALVLSYKWNDEEERVLGVRFYSAQKPPILDFIGYNLPLAPRRYATTLEVEEVPRVQRLARAFEVKVVPGWAYHSVAPSPFGLQCVSNETRFKARATGPVTHHELIEAHLLVRGWVAQNAPELLPDWK